LPTIDGIAEIYTPLRRIQYN